MPRSPVYIKNGLVNIAMESADRDNENIAVLLVGHFFLSTQFLFQVALAESVGTRVRLVRTVSNAAPARTNNRSSRVRTATRADRAYVIRKLLRAPRAAEATE